LIVNEGEHGGRQKAGIMGFLQGDNFPSPDFLRAWRFLRRHDDWRIRSIYGGSTFVATQDLDHSSHVIAMHSLSKLMDRLEDEVSTDACG
jgi:hypothetical protein